MIPVISGTVADQTVDVGDTINPFTNVSIVDPNDYVSDVTLTITLLDANGNPTDANGTLSIPTANLGNDTFAETSPGVYVLTDGSTPGPSSTVPFFQPQLADITFLASDAATTTFSLAEQDGYGEHQTDTTTTVTGNGATISNGSAALPDTSTNMTAPSDPSTSSAALSDTTNTAAPSDPSTSSAAPSDPSTSSAAPSDPSTSSAAASDTSTSSAVPSDTSTSSAAPSDISTSVVASSDNSTSSAAPSDTSTGSPANTDIPTDPSSGTSTNVITVRGFVSSNVTKTLTSDSQLVIDHPNRFHGQVDLGSGDVDLNGLAKADNYSFNNDMLTIYDSSGKALDKLRLTCDSSSFSVEKTATGVSIYTADDVVHSSTGTLLPLNS
jgi:hypothetical protein